MRQARRLFVLVVSALFFLLVRPADPAVKGYTKGRQVAPLTQIKSGDYIWHPEVSPAGPVLVLVSLPDQVLYVYRNGVRIGRSTVSTGTKGHRTPTGVFTILQKKVDHESNIYKGAKMPHMQRLTWGGIAMHAGQLPGYPASHGCVRLPEDFAEKLYSVTTMGTTVIIADNNSGPDMTTNPGLLFTGKPSPALPVNGVFWRPENANKGPVSVIVSVADKHAYVYRNGIEIGRAPVSNLGRVKGTFAYSALDATDSNGRREWMSVTSSGGRAPNLKNLADQAVVDPEFLANLRSIISPGTSLILTSMPVSSETHSKSGFSILTASNAETVR